MSLRLHMLTRSKPWWIIFQETDYHQTVKAEYYKLKHKIMKALVLKNYFF